MKKYIVVFIVLVLAACNNTERVSVGNNQATVNNTDDSITSFLYDFYSFYIHKCFEENSSFRDIQHDLQTYCTPKFLNGILEDDEIDSDPFVDAQDYVEDWRETMTVQKASDSSNVYVVCLWTDNYSGKDHCVKVYLAQIDGKWKIDNVLALDDASPGVPQGIKN
jgi:hypothetical protein